MKDEWAFARGRCLTCVNWRGDREKVYEEYVRCPASFDLRDGWAEAGRCALSQISVPSGDCDANFGCIHWEAEA
jgi:hypothetical protein